MPPLGGKHTPVVLNPTDLQDTHKASTFVVNPNGDYVECERPTRVEHSTCSAHLSSGGATATIEWDNQLD